MKKLTPIIFILFCLTSLAHAKVTLNNSVMDEIHLNTIKGMLYDITHSEEAKKDVKTKVILPNAARAIAWVNECYTSKKIYKLEKIKTDNAKIILHAIKIITNVTNGQYPGLPINEVMIMWRDLGSRVIIQHVAKEGRITWKFELKSKKKPTQNLVLKHKAKIVKIKKL